MASNCLESESKNPAQALPTSPVSACPVSAYSESSDTLTFLVSGCAGLLAPASRVLFPQFVLSSLHGQLSSTLALNENVT